MTTRPNTIRDTGLLTALHLIVDGLCACCIFLMAPGLQGNTYILLFIAYNVLAFLTQPLVGIWLDNTKFCSRTLSVSVALLACGALLSIIQTTFGISFLPYIVAVVIGIGNSLFHVFGGKYVTLKTANDSRHLGVLVSSGALGLVIGGQFASYTLTGILTVSLTVLTYIFLRLTKENDFFWNHSIRRYPLHRWSTRNSISLLCFMLLIVFLRSYIGKLIPDQTPQLAIIPFWLCVVAVMGKALGGFLSRILSEGTTLFLVLFLTGICFLLGFYHWGFLMATIFLINLTMPLTLHLTNACLPRREGFAFGILAAMLLPGVALCETFYYYNDIAYRLLYPLIGTLIVEVVVLLTLFRDSRWKVLAISVVMNILTNVPLNIAVLFWLPSPLPLYTQLGLESLVVLIETIFFYFALRNWKRASLYSLTCNATSYLVGLVYAQLAS